MIGKNKRQVVLKLTLTVDEEIYQLMKKEAKKLGFNSFASYIRYILHERYAVK